jgi:hypothetical protein
VGGGATHAVAAGPGVGAVGAFRPSITGSTPTVSFPPRCDPLSLLPPSFVQVHKSQGMGVDRAVLHLKKAFEVRLGQQKREREC